MLTVAHKSETGRVSTISSFKPKRVLKVDAVKGAMAEAQYHVQQDARLDDCKGTAPLRKNVH